jgi:ketosteroid isomerase-like protein
MDMIKMATTLLVVGGLALGAEKSADGVKAAEKSWAAATVAGDEAALKLVLSPDMTYTHSTGETDTRDSFIDNLKTGARKYTKLDHDGMEVRMYGDTAVLTATAQVATSQNGGAANSVHLRFIHVWVWQGGRWQMVAHQSLRLAN